MSPALDEAVARLGMALLHFLWQGALIGCVAGAGLVVLRNARAQARYAWCGACLLLCLALPLWQVLAPAATDTGAAQISAPVDRGEPAHRMLAGRAHVLSEAAWRPRLPAVVAAWGLGALLMALRLGWGLAEVRRLSAGVGGCGAMLDPLWLARLTELAQRMGLRRVPQLRLVDALDGPVTVGRWRPLVLLPTALLARMPVELVEALLAHELAHVRRLDYLANLAQSVVEVLLFFHPVVWWLSHRLRIEREQIADDLAARALGDPRRLALALSGLAHWQASHGPLAVPELALSAQGGHLMARIAHLVRPARRPLGRSLLVPLGGLAAMAIAAYAAGFTAVAAPAPQAVPASAGEAAPAPSRWGHLISLGDERSPFAYALMSGRDGHTTMSGTGKDLREAEARRAKLGGDLLWVRRGTQRFVVTDPAALAEVRALFEPAQAFDAPMDKLGEQIDAQAEVLERLSREIADRHALPAAELDALGQQMAQLQQQRRQAEAELDRLSRRMAATQGEKRRAQLEQAQDRLERALRPLDASIDALEAQIDRLHGFAERAVDEAVEKHEREAEAAIKALSKQMEGLSEQQEAAVAAAERQLRALIPDLVRRGLAQKG